MRPPSHPRPDTVAPRKKCWLRYLAAAMLVVVTAGLVRSCSCNRGPRRPPGAEVEQLGDSDGRAQVPSPHSSGGGVAPSSAQNRRRAAASPPGNSSPNDWRSWTSPGLCEGNSSAAAVLAKRWTLQRTFAATDINELRIWHDRDVPASVLSQVEFAIARTRRYAKYRFGWNPR